MTVFNLSEWHNCRVFKLSIQSGPCEELLRVSNQKKKKKNSKSIIESQKPYFNWINNCPRKLQSR